MIAKYQGLFFNVSALHKKPLKIWRYDNIDGFIAQRHEDGFMVYKKFVDISEIEEIFDVGFSVRWNGKWCGANPSRDGTTVALLLGWGNEAFATEHGFHEIERDRGMVVAWGLDIDIDQCEEFRMTIWQKYPRKEETEQTLSQAEWLDVYKKTKMELLPPRCQMNTNDAIIDAFAKGNLMDVLRGSNGYSVGVDQGVSPAAPTDWNIVLPLFYKYAKETGVDEAKTMLEHAILSLLHSTAEDLYIGMSVLYRQILNEEDDRSPIVINRENLLGLVANRKKESETKQRQGWNNIDSLWAKLKPYQKQSKTMNVSVVIPLSGSIKVRPAGRKRNKIDAQTFPKAAYAQKLAMARARGSLAYTLPQEKNKVAKGGFSVMTCSKDTESDLRKHKKRKKTKKMANGVSKKIKF